MATTLPISLNEANTVVTRLRKKRNLETTMTTLKQLLEPTLAPISTKTGSRKKNKPRSLAKKVVAPKKVNPSENCSEGEYYPNKMKRKVRLKKTILKPRHELKVVLATNKRKRCTPYKGQESLYEELPTNTPKTTGTTIVQPSSSHTEPNIFVQTSQFSSLNVLEESQIEVDTELKIHTPPPSLNPSKYELISPPHKSLTEMTVDDLIRMDEDSLSDENLMEILTCPSPVWWENPNECTGSLFLTTGETGTPTDVTKDASTAHLNDNAIGMKRGAVRKNKSKAKKIAKLETILGHIKSLARVDNNTPTNNDVANTIDSDTIVQNKDNDKNIKEIRTCDISKRRKISSSGSDISVNEDDLLRNLESITIPIQKQTVDEKITDLEKDFVDKNIDVANDHKIIRATVRETPRDAEKQSSEESERDKIASDKWYGTSKGPEHYRKKYINKNKESNSLIDSNKEGNSSKIKKSILKRLQKQNDDILDVRLIKTPTNVTNEVKVWSKIDNFKIHNFKPEDFVSEVIDVEDELEFSIIENSPIREHRVVKSKSETILIDDDSNDAIYDIRECNDVTIASTLESQELLQICGIIDDDDSKKTMVSKDIVKEDATRIANDFDGRIVENTGVLQDASIKPKRTRKKATTLKEPRKNNVINEKIKSSEISASRGNALALPLDAVTPQCCNRIIEVIDNTDANDTILCLDDVNIVSLVKNSASGIAKINEIQVQQNDLSITLVKAVPITTQSPTKDILESPKSVKSVTSESTVECSEGMISDTNIQFLDEYEDNNRKEKNLDNKGKRAHEELDIEVTKDIIIVKNFAEEEYEAKHSDQSAEDDTVADIDMAHDGNNCGLGDLNDDDKIYEIKYFDYENSTNVDEETNRDANIFDYQVMNKQGSLEGNQDQITENFHEIPMVEHSLADRMIKNKEQGNKNKGNSNEKEIKHLHTQDFDKGKITDQEELVTIYQIVSSTSEIENITNEQD